MFSPEANGVGTTAFNQARMLAARGHEIFYVTPAPFDPHGVIENLRLSSWKTGVTCRSILWSAYLRLGLQSVTPLDVDIEKFASRVKRGLDRLVADENIDAVLFSESFQTAAYWRPPSGCAMLMNFLCPRYLFQKIGLSNAPVNSKLDALDRGSVKAADARYAPTAKMRELASDYYRMDPSSIAVIPSAIDAEKFSPSGGIGSRREILFVGRFTREKGADVVIDVIPPVLEKFPDAIFTVVGESGVDADGAPFIEKLLARAGGAQNRIHWERNVPYSMLPEIYKRARVFVFPTMFESFGLVIAEAHASGVPVVVADAGGTPELVENGKTGFLVPQRDSKSAREAVERILSDPALAESLGRAARKRALELWSFDAVGPKLEAFIRDAVARVRKD
jgi:glycosyltransferase involved in cell wall biosynthesis